MKKILSLVCCALMVSAINAQVLVGTSPNSAGSFQCEGMSANHGFVAGENMDNHTPMIWNTENNTVVSILVAEDIPDVGTVYQSGAFHAVNDAGVAVGDLASNLDYVARPIMATGDGQYTTLYMSESDAGASAHGITADGNIVVGFHYGADWTTHACIWTNNGQTRTDLPVPTAEQMGIEIDYVSSRWISADGTVILGYAQDSYSGSWVAMAWRKNGSEYVPYCFAAPYFQSMEEPIPADNKPYFLFEPSSLSQDGTYAGISVIEVYDLNDYSINPVQHCGRFNLTTGQFEMLNTDIAHDQLFAYGVANNGTVAGRLVGEMDLATYMQETEGFVWESEGLNNVMTLTQLSDDPLFADAAESHLMGISSDGRYLLGYVVDVSGLVVSFILDKTGHVGVSDVESPVVNPRYKGIYDMNGRKLDAIRSHGVYIIDGKKVVR